MVSAAMVERGDAMKHWKRWLMGAGGAAMLQWGAAGCGAHDTVPLAGSWRFQLDRHDAGVMEKWFDRTLPGSIRLPGSLPAQGIGDEVTMDTSWTGGIVDKSWFTAPEYAKYRQPGHVKVPFWLQPEKYYAGAAWYQRDIEVPAGWQNKRVVLFLERAHWETRVWADGRRVGTLNGLSTPHEYDLGVLAPGRHALTIRVDNRLIVDIGENSHAVSDHTQGNWNGIVGKVELRVMPGVWFEDLQVYPHVATRSVTVKGRVNAKGRLASPPKVNVTVAKLDAKPGHHPVAKSATVSLIRWPDEGEFAGGLFEAEVPMGPDASLWDEFSPALYQLTAAMDNGAQKTVVFGLREISAAGTQLAINGRKTFIRGTLECCIFPKTGHPPTDVNEWRRIVRVAKSCGLNLLRFHSYCPPEAAFQAADELGCYVQIETCWANMSTTLGDGKPVDEWVYAETDRILKYYGNHPSFLLMPYGNEPGGRNHKAYLAKWVEHYKARDPRRFWTSGSGWPELPENQWHCVPGPRIQAWGGGLKSRINAKPPETCTDYRDYIGKRSVPVVSHEIGQWCVYPNFEEIRKYTGYLKPGNFEIFRDRLAERGMSNLARKFLLASGRLQTLCYKEDIESALRTPGMGGFELLDLHDFPGQGTALVGVLDPFWEEKGYVTPKEYSRFCNSTVPLARLARRVFTTDEKLEADIEVAHFGPSPIESAVTSWKLVGDDGKAVAGGGLPRTTIAVGNGMALGHVSAELNNVPAPARYKLVVKIGPVFENDWDVWVYPAKADTQPPQGVLVTGTLDDKTLAALDAGGNVLLMIPPKRVRNAAGDKVVLGFSSIFWNTAWTRRQPPTTLGILCDPKHPAFADFPTDDHSNWQWWYLVTRAGAMILDDLPRGVRPVVQVIDDWFTAHKLGLVFEARLGKGRLLVCSVDLKNDLDANPVARQMLHSLLRYMAGDRFRPAVQLTADQVRGLVVEPSAAN
jgi:Glycosyl hydrolases family 2, sugar binding domain